MSQKNIRVLIPLIASVSFVLTFWLTNVRTESLFLGLSADLAGGLTSGFGIGLMLALLWSIRPNAFTQ